MDALEYFSGRRVAVCFSGGVDSSYLLHLAVESGADAVPIYADIVFDRPSDRDRAQALCERLGLELVHVSPELSQDILANGPDRCYLCKTSIMSAIRRKAEELGCDVVVDGTNASDREDERPGMRALREQGIESPLRMLGLTKENIRRLSREAGLPGWDLPSNSCTATRIATGVPITGENMMKVVASENILASMGFSGFRVRTDGVDATVQVRASEHTMAEERWEEIALCLQQFFNNVVLDSNTRD